MSELTNVFQRDTALSKKASGSVIHEMLLTQLLQYEHKQAEVSTCLPNKPLPLDF